MLPSRLPWALCRPLNPQGQPPALQQAYCRTVVKRVLLLPRLTDRSEAQRPSNLLKVARGSVHVQSQSSIWLPLQANPCCSAPLSENSAPQLVTQFRTPPSAAARSARPSRGVLCCGRGYREGCPVLLGAWAEAGPGRRGDISGAGPCAGESAWVSGSSHVRVKPDLGAGFGEGTPAPSSGAARDGCQYSCWLAPSIDLVPASPRGLGPPGGVVSPDLLRWDRGGESPRRNLRGRERRDGPELGPPDAGRRRVRSHARRVCRDQR